MSSLSPCLRAATHTLCLRGQEALEAFSAWLSVSSVLCPEKTKSTSTLSYCTFRPTLFRPRAACSAPYSLSPPAAGERRESGRAQQQCAELSVIPAGLLVLVLVLVLSIASNTRSALMSLRPSPAFPTLTLPVNLCLCDGPAVWVQLPERLSRELPVITTHCHADAGGASAAVTAAVAAAALEGNRTQP